jgi:hypothetical protein
MRPGVGDIVTVTGTAEGYARRARGKQVVVTEILESGSGVRAQLIENTYNLPDFALWWGEILDSTLTAEQLFNDIMNL